MADKLKFTTNYKYVDRETKQRYVYEKYQQILQGSILDVGADELYLKKHLAAGTKYVGIGLGDNPELQQVDLEKEKIPFGDNEFDTVLCLDVLEHIENIHEIFDELCRVSKEWVIISLPNPYSSLMGCLQNGQYKPGRNTKYYGLPLDREPDRHKWFFSATEAKDFVKYRAQKNNMEVYDIYADGEGTDGLGTQQSKEEKEWVDAVRKAREVLFRKDLNFADLYEGTQWFVLRKNV
jgi:hypothetical protein